MSATAHTRDEWVIPAPASPAMMAVDAAGVRSTRGLHGCAGSSRRGVAVPAVRGRAIARPCRRATRRRSRSTTPARHAGRRAFARLVPGPGGLARLGTPRPRLRTADQRHRPRRRSVVGRARRTAGARRGDGHRERPDRLARLPPREGLQHAPRRRAGWQLDLRHDHLSRVRRPGVLQRGELSDLGRAGQRPAELHARSGADRDPRRRRAGLDPVGDGHLARAGERGQTSTSRSRSWPRPPTSSPTRPPSTPTAS